MNTGLSFLILVALWFTIGSDPLTAGNPEKTRQLIATLQSNAPFYDKARACQQLGEIGTSEAVPALAALLTDEHLNAYARSGLEGIAGSSATEALRAALSKVTGNQLIGVINSLGVLRDGKAAGALAALASDPGSGVAKEALLALGRISNPQSIGILNTALTKGPEPSRADAAAACLLAAEQQLKDGRTELAAALYDSVRMAQVSMIYRAGATRGAILARKDKAPAFLAEQLHSEERAIRNVALLTIRELPSDAMAAVLNAEVARVSPELQVLLLTALADCHNRDSLQVLSAKAADANADVRKTALTVLGKIGSPAEAGVLLANVAEPRSPEESELAINSLRALNGEAVDVQVLSALAKARSPDEKIRLIGLLDNRGVTNAAGPLLAQAEGEDVNVSLAALTALKSLASPREVAPLIAFVKACKDGARRAAAEKALYSACLSIGKADAGVLLLEPELYQATEPAQKISWIRILTMLGTPKALPALKSSLRDSDQTVVMAAIENLGQWHDPAPIEDLLGVAETGPDARVRKASLAAALRLASAAVDERQRPGSVAVQWLERAGKSAQSAEEKRLLISTLGRLKTQESFRLIRAYLDDPALQAEASLAVLQIAPALVKSSEAAALKADLEKIASSTNNNDLRTRAEKLKKSITVNP